MSVHTVSPVLATKQDEEFKSKQKAISAFVSGDCGYSMELVLPWGTDLQMGFDTFISDAYLQ